jgi:hypothetical protein
MHTLPNLPRSVASKVYASLCDLLPQPRIDTPEARAETAMAAVVALHPADASEALFAVQACHRV